MRLSTIRVRLIEVRPVPHRFRLRRQARILWVLVVAAALAAGCTRATAASSPTTQAPQPTPTLLGTSQATPAGTAATTTSTAPALKTTATTTLNTRAPSPPATTQASPGSPPTSSPTGPQPAASGTYQYSQSGSFTAVGTTSEVPTSGTMVVDPPKADGPGTWTQVWHSYPNTSQPPNDTTFLFAPSGISIASEVLRVSYSGQTVSFTCPFSPPIEIMPWPLRVGYNFSGAASCGSSFNLTVAGSITGTQPVVFDGGSVTTYVITTTVKSTGQINSTNTEVEWFDPALSLEVNDQTNESGTYDGFSFSSQVTRNLKSGHPS